MKLTKCNIIAAIRIIIFIVVALVVLLLVVGKPQNGRRFTVHIIDTIVLQADPPAKKLIKYMNEKYDKNFVQVSEEPIFDSDKRHHTFGSGSWGFWYNGITVTTDDSSGEYYHVREPVHIESKSTQKRVDMRNNTHSFSVNSFYLIVF